MRFRSFRLAVLAGLSLLFAACGGNETPQPSGPPAAIGDAPAELATTDTQEQERPTQNESPEATEGDSGLAEDQAPPTGLTDRESLNNDDTAGSLADGDDDPTSGAPSGPNVVADLVGLLPAADSLPDAVASGYESIGQLITDRTERPPLMRCSIAEDPTSLAIASNGRAAGRTFAYSDGVRTTTIQLWDYPDEATAIDAIDLIEQLRCDGLAVGPATIGAINYARFDSAEQGLATAIPEGVDQIATVRFERLLEASEGSLVVREELQFARVGTVVVFAGAQEIQSPETEPAPPIADARRLAEDTISSILGADTSSEGSGLAAESTIDSPLLATVGTQIAPGTYRSTAPSFCLVLVRQPDGTSTQLQWANGEQAIVELLERADVEFGEGCGTWTPIDLSSLNASDGFAGGSGTLVTGVDIANGPLLITSTGDCRIDRLAGFSGTPADLITSTFLAPGESIDLNLTSEVGVYLASDCRY